MKQARDYRKYNIRLTSADWQRGSDRVLSILKARKRDMMANNHELYASVTSY